MPSNKKYKYAIGTDQNIGWYENAAAKSILKSEKYARDIPQPIHSHPNKYLYGQGILNIHNISKAQITVTVNNNLFFRCFIFFILSPPIIPHIVILAQKTSIFNELYLQFVNNVLKF